MECEQVKKSGLTELWLDSQSPEAVKAAMASGLAVDVVVRPWDLLKGESCPDPDRNISGMTGLDLDKLPEARFNPINHQVERFGNWISPDDPGLANHFNRLLGLIPGKGIHAVVILESEPPGYESATARRMQLMSPSGMMINGAEVLPGLQNLVPDLFDRGYSLRQRLAFLAKYAIDPIDLTDPNVSQMAPKAPYFDAQMMSGAFSQYPNIHFPTFPPRSLEFDKDWSNQRHQSLDEKLHEFESKVEQICPTIFVEEPNSGSRDFNYSAFRFVRPPSARKLDPSTPIMRFITFSPLNTEDELGNKVYKPEIPTDQPFFFDLSEVLPAQFSSYLHYVVKG